MKATGIVRRIDDLGRVVIPKEIRRTMRIREGDPLEIFTDRDGGVILKKYSPIGEMGRFAQEFADSIQKALDQTVLICDTDVIIAVAGASKREYLDKGISREVEQVMEQRTLFVTGRRTGLSPVPVLDLEQGVNYAAQMICPVLSRGEAIGAVLLVHKTEAKEYGEVEQKVVSTAANFLGKQIEH
ncbi:MAG: stage V sporulation protein T [Clostridiales bacterium]|nr:stage V sporulation protein T [Clostridiales bacterium]